MQKIILPTLRKEDGITDSHLIPTEFSFQETGHIKF